MPEIELPSLPHNLDVDEVSHEGCCTKFYKSIQSVRLKTQNMSCGKDVLDLKETLSRSQRHIYEGVSKSL